MCWHPNPKERIKFPQIVDQLERIIVHVSITASEKAQQFWINHFTHQLQESVHWEELAKVIVTSPSLHLHLTNDGGDNSLQEITRSLEDLVLGESAASDANNRSKMVTMERFNQLCLWFGDWFASAELFDEMHRIAKAAWFHNDINLTDSIGRLSRRAAGTFMIRMSYTDRRAPMTLALMNHEGLFEQKRIYRLGAESSVKERYALQFGNTTQFKKYESLGALLADLKLTGVITYPCPKNMIRLAY